MGALRIKNDTGVTFVSFSSMVEGGEHLLSRAPTYILFMFCTNLLFLPHIEELETLFGIPVICSNQAVFWHAMTLAGKTAKCAGYGKLLKLKRETSNCLFPGGDTKRFNILIYSLR